MPSTSSADVHRTLGRGELVSLAYRLGRQGASGMLTLTARGARAELFVLRRGGAVCPEGELARRAVVARLARAAAEPAISARFDSGVTAYPPGAPHQVALASWARGHLEAQLDAARADALVDQLAGARLSLRPELAPEPVDEADRRMIAALALPRRLDQLWMLARTPRFRLLAFLHFLRGVGALHADGRVAERSALPGATDPRRAAALQLLGLDDTADAERIKRAYRRLARAVHPDLQPEVDGAGRRALERRFAELAAAYETLI